MAQSRGRGPLSSVSPVRADIARVACFAGRVVGAAALATACGPTSPPPLANHDSAPAPAATPALEGRCLASFARKRPAGWLEVGQLRIGVAEGRPTSIAAEDTRGLVAEMLAPPKTKEDARTAMRAFTCRLGGLVLVVDEDAMASAAAAPDAGASTVLMPVFAPRVADERSDVLALCKEPAEDVPTDAVKRYRRAFDTLDERLTSRRWRAWLWDLLEEVDRTEGIARETIRMEKADELRDAANRAQLGGPCWYEKALRRPILR